MSRTERFWNRLGDVSDLDEELLPFQSVVEIAGDRRVLIEHHLGVKAYSREKIIINMQYGLLHVCGKCLELGRMSREQLVIRGEIDCITMQRR